MNILKKFAPMLAAFALILLCLLAFSTEARAAEITASGTCGDNLT